MFVIIGERINTSRKAVFEAVEQRDAPYIQGDVKRQEDAGATYIDVNAGARIGHEIEDMIWLIEVIQEAVNLPLALDSPDPNVLEKVWSLVKQPPMVNSISLEKKRYEPLLAFLEGKACSVIALCMDDDGMPKGVQDVVERAGRLVEGLEGIGLKRDGIYVDPLIQPISTDITKGLMAMECVQGIMKEYPGVHIACGLSNVSYGLPQRKFVNRVFLSLLMAAGVDGAIIDPLDDKMMAVLKTTQMLLGQDQYCMNYIRAARAGKIVA
jgi:5-methyltetrahydrofolate--homocysteine methyltransferase